MGLVHTKGVEQVIQHLMHVVPGTVDHVVGDGPLGGEHIAPLISHETERILQHLEKVMPHKQGLMFVYCESRVMLAGGKAEVYPPGCYTILGDKPVKLWIKTESRILEVHRVHCVIGHRNLEALAGHHFLNVECNDAAEATPRTPAIHAVEIDEIDGRSWTDGVPYAVAHTGRDECQMRVAVSRFHNPLPVGKVMPQVQFVVMIAGVLWKYGLKDLHVRKDPHQALQT